MSQNLDRALEALSDPNQHTSEASYGTAPDPTRCWRCSAEGVNEVGLCEGCVAWMRAEREDDPAALADDGDEGDDGCLPDTVGPARFEAGGSDPLGSDVRFFDGQGQERIRFDFDGITFMDEQGTPHLFIPADGSGIYRMDGNELRDLTRPKLHQMFVAMPLITLAIAWLVCAIVWALR